MNSSDVQRVLDTTGIAARIHRFESPVRTFAEAKKAVPAPDVFLAKSIMFQVKARLLLLIIPARSRVSPDLLSEVLQVDPSQIKLASSELIEQITGFSVGGLPPFGFRKRVETLMDNTLLDCSMLFLGGGDDFSLLEIKPHALLEATGGEAVQLISTEGT
jgi:prolyl-tRNA editing enzyme YbaK/EbsC (Cys-tRNA(Pro) deacylase)